MRVSPTAGPWPAVNGLPRSRSGPGSSRFTPDPSGPSRRDPRAMVTITVALADSRSPDVAALDHQLPATTTNIELDQREVLVGGEFVDHLSTVRGRAWADVGRLH